MSPKQKSMELVGKFADIQKYSSMKVVAKNCALIVVEEVLKVTCLKDFNYKKYNASSLQFNNNNEFISYWQEVKQEIESL